jgi:hypothetical protein
VRARLVKFGGRIAQPRVCIADDEVDGCHCFVCRCRVVLS